jgi:tetratricopeptide (TPR) repeat protein
MAIENPKAIEPGKDAPSPYREYVRLLRDLHFLMAEGKGDSDEAERVRDLMDDPWYQMNPQEIRRVEGLSADLYTLVDPPPPPQQLEPQVIAEFEQLAGAAAKDNDWDRVLELFRELPHPYPPHNVAFIRSVAWDNFGDPETSLLFLERAVSLSPGKFEYLDWYIFMLLQVGRVRDALLNADRILNASGFVQPDGLYKAADALFGMAHTLYDEGATKAVIEKAIDLMRRALDNEEKLPEHDRSERSKIGAYVKLGVCYSRLGREDLAFEAFDAALKLDHKNDVALISRGLLRLKSKEASSTEDFKRAVETGTPYVWPYYYLAWHLLETGDFGACLRTSRAGLQRTNDPSMTAEFYEMIALSQYALDEEKGRVDNTFEVARSLAPLNGRIAHNYRLYLQSHSKPVSSSTGWNLEWERDPDEASRELSRQFSNQLTRQFGNQRDSRTSAA